MTDSLEASDILLPEIYKVPVGGGMSLPYVIDFSKCMPESNITITVRLMNSSNNTDPAKNVIFLQSNSYEHKMQV